MDPKRVFAVKAGLLGLCVFAMITPGALAAGGARQADNWKASNDRILLAQADYSQCQTSGPICTRARDRAQAYIDMSGKVMMSSNSGVLAAMTAACQSLVMAELTNACGNEEKSLGHMSCATGLYKYSDEAKKNAYQSLEAASARSDRPMDFQKDCRFETGGRVPDANSADSEDAASRRLEHERDGFQSGKTVPKEEPNRPPTSVRRNCGHPQCTVQ